MATPTIRSALANLYTVLGTISTTNSYKTDVATVRRYVLDWEDASQEGLPWVGFSPGITTAGHLHGSCIRCVHAVSIAAHVRANTQSDAYDNLEDLIDDIIAAVELDPTRGQFAVSTMYKQHQTDEGSPDHMDHRGGTASAVVEFDIIYNRTTSGS